VLRHADDLRRDAELANANAIVEPDRLQALRDVVDPAALPALKEAGEGSLRLYDFLRSLSEEDRQEQLPAEAA